jgi:hypothetical protein
VDNVGYYDFYFVDLKCLCLDEFIRLDKALLLQMKCGLCYCCCASN